MLEIVVPQMPIKEFFDWSDLTLPHIMKKIGLLLTELFLQPSLRFPISVYIVHINIYKHTYMHIYSICSVINVCAYIHYILCICIYVRIYIHTYIYITTLK